MTLQPLTAAHWPQVRAIYQRGLATGNATFQTEALGWADLNQGHLPHRRLVGRRGRLGQQGGVWRDALLPQRRRAVVGTAAAGA